MNVEDIAAAIKRAERILERRPEVGLSEDSIATVHWEGGLRMRASHAEGHAVGTDMPTELGGCGNHVSPGWLLRAGLASCLATSIAMLAASRGVVLARLDVRASSRSDLRGLIGMREVSGAAVDPRPQDVELQVNVAAEEVSAGELREIVAEAHRRAPMSAALAAAIPVRLRICIGDSAG